MSQNPFVTKIARQARRGNPTRRWSAGVVLAMLATLAAAAWLGPGAARAEDAPGVVWTVKKKFALAPAPIAADLTADGAEDFVLIGQDNRVTALDASGRNALWDVILETDGKLGPAAAGHFFADGGIDVAAVSTSGVALILNGATGELRATHKLGFEPVGPPIALPLDPDSPNSQLLDGLAFLSGTGQLVALKFGARGQAPTVAFKLTLTGGHSAPPAVAKTRANAPGPHLVGVSYRGAISVTSIQGEGSRVIDYAIPGANYDETWFAVGDIDGDKFDDVVVADGLGYIQAFTVDGATMRPIWDRVSGGTKPISSPVIVDVNGDGKGDILFPKSGRELVLIDGATGSRSGIWADPDIYNHDSNMKSPPSIFTAADGTPCAVFSDEKNTLLVMDLKTRRIKAGPAGPLRFDLADFAQCDPLVARFSGGDAIQVMALGWREGTGSLIDLGMKAGPGFQSWEGPKGSVWRTGSMSPWRAAYVARQNSAIAGEIMRWIDLGRKAGAAGDWKAAIAHYTRALEASPANPEALSLRRSAKIRQNILALLLAGLMGLGVVAGLGYPLGVVALRKIRLRSVQRAIARGDQSAAAELLLRIYKAQPGNTANLRSLADLYINVRKHDHDSAEIYLKASKAFPEDDRYLKNLGMAYAHAKRRDSTAREVFQTMLQSSGGGAWAMELGETCLALGEDAEALKAFRQAAQLGVEDGALPGHLADLYVKLDIHRPEILPVMLRVMPHRLGDRAFLSVYCKASQEARVHDEAAIRAATSLLELDAEAGEAHILLASRYLQEGRTKESMQHAEAILRKLPNNSVGLRLLGACYAAENRLDETAMQIFQRALAANPEANEILVAVSKGYIQEGREDTDAIEIYRRALKGTPNAETILEHVSSVAGRRQDDDLTIQTCEKLIEIGRRSRRVVLQLADAYCRLGTLSDKAEPVYREALLYQADHATVAQNLGAIYMNKGRIDPEALVVYETVFARDPAKRDIGRQLARSYAAADLSEKALKTAQHILAGDPNDNEMKKIAANAALSLDQLDSAITSYEQILDRTPDDDESLARLAQLYGKKRLGDAHALNIYQRAAKIRGDNFEIHSALARAWTQRREYDQAVTAIKHFLSHAPGQIGVAIGLMEELVEADHQAFPLRWFLVETLTYDGRLREANKHLSDMLRLDPAQSETALGGFEKILDKNPKDATALHQRGRILKDLGRQSEARQALELAHRYRAQDENIIRDLMDIYQALLEGKESMEIRFQLGRLAMAAAKYDLAISCFQKTDKDYRWENTSVKQLGRCFMAKGMLDLSLQELRRLSMDDEVKEILYELAQRYEAVNDPKGAREVYKMIFAVDIAYRDVKGKLESLRSGVDPLSAERTAIINALSDQAKNRYELLEELGRGAMGIVYKAQDHELDEIVALKILPESLGNNAEALRRFRQEARNARHLSHPNIVRIHDIGEEAGRKYISMEFVDGINIKERMAQVKRQLPFEETLRYTIQTVAAMAAAHEAGIVHRDIKPANVMITREGKIKIADFGIAKAVQDDNPESTRAGAIVGTPLYMSPEQVQGRNVDTRSDLYSLGVMLYEMISGMPPFYEGDLAFHHLFTEPKPLACPDPLFGEIVMKCLVKDMDKRWQNGREILEQLKKIKVPAAAGA